MKNNKGITLIALILIILVILMFGSVIFIKLKENSEQNSVTSSTNNESKNEDEDKIVNKEEINNTENLNQSFWLMSNYINFPSQKDTCTINLFEKEIALPINIEDLDNYYNEGYYCKIIYGTKTFNNIKELIESDTLILGTFDNIHYYNNDIELEDAVISINNLNGNQMTYKEAIQNKWWIIEFNNVEDCLKLSNVENVQSNITEQLEYDSNNSEILDCLIEKLGGPKNIYINNDEGIDYLMCYEYENFILTINIEEYYENNDSYICNLKNAIYGPKEMLEANIADLIQNGDYEKLK